MTQMGGSFRVGLEGYVGRGRLRACLCVCVSVCLAGPAAAAASPGAAHPWLVPLPGWVVHGRCLLVGCESGLRTGLSTVRLIRPSCAASSHLQSTFTNRLDIICTSPGRGSRMTSWPDGVVSAGDGRPCTGLAYPTAAPGERSVRSDEPWRHGRCRGEGGAGCHGGVIGSSPEAYVAGRRRAALGEEPGGGVDSQDMRALYPIALDTQYTQYLKESRVDWENDHVSLNTAEGGVCPTFKSSS